MEHELSPDEAQQRIEQVQHFQQELAQLREDGVLELNQAQQSAIDDYHSNLFDTLSRQFYLDLSAGQRQLSVGMKVASLIGALALSASLFFVFYQFWGVIPLVAQVSILVAAPMLSFAGAIWFKTKEPDGFFSKIAALLSLVCFVLDLSLLGQMFNITPSPNAFAAWALYGFILAYICNARLILFLSLVFTSLFIAMKLCSWAGWYWVHFGNRPEHFLIPAVVIFCVPLWFTQRRFSDFSSIYRLSGMLLFFIPILILSNLGSMSYLRLDDDLVEGIYQILGFALSGGSIYLAIKQRWRDTVNTGIFFFVLFLYIKLCDWFWEWLPKYLFFLLMALTAILILLILKRYRAIVTAEVAHEA